MERKDELKRNYIKNCTCSYFDDIMTLEDIDSSDVLLYGKKKYKNILIYDISYKTLMGSKPLRIKFDR